MIVWIQQLEFREYMSLRKPASSWYSIFGGYSLLSCLCVSATFSFSHISRRLDCQTAKDHQVFCFSGSSANHSSLGFFHNVKLPAVHFIEDTVLFSKYFLLNASSWSSFMKYQRSCACKRLSFSFLVSRSISMTSPSLTRKPYNIPGIPHSLRPDATSVSFDHTEGKFQSTKYKSGILHSVICST